MGVLVLTNRPNDYAVRPFLISGTCCCESVQDQTSLLDTAITAFRDSPKVPRALRLLCVGTDGAGQRQNALIKLTMAQKIPTFSPLYPTVSLLRLFFDLVGPDDLTHNPDWKHDLKRLRNNLIRSKGLTVDGVPISTGIIKEHLKIHSVTPIASDRLLALNDRQDVVLTLQLLNAIAHLSPSSEADEPSSRSSCRILRLLGTIYLSLLEAYLDVSLSLSQRLEHLSTATHLLLALYNKDKGRFMPVQTFFNLQSTIRNIFICVMKTQHNNPLGKLFIILLGTDGLEKVFAKVRTMIGNDTNVDVLQLCNHIDGAVSCVKILEMHPDWGGQSRRLNLKSLKDQGNEISRDMDHINPCSITGDSYVKDVSVVSCWNQG